MIDLIPCVGGPLDGEFCPDFGPDMVHEDPPKIERVVDMWQTRTRPIYPDETRRHEYKKDLLKVDFYNVNVLMPIYWHQPFKAFMTGVEWIIKYFLVSSQDDTVLPWDFPASLGRFGKGTPIPIVRDWFEEHGYPNFGICSILTMIENRTLVSVCGPKVFPSWQEAILSLDFRRDR